MYHPLLVQEYPLDYAKQGISILYPEERLQFLALNSCWQIDQFNPKRSGIHPEAVSHAIDEARRQVKEAREAGTLTDDDRILRFGVWHHAIRADGRQAMPCTDFVDLLQDFGVKVCLHGDIHKMKQDIVGYRMADKQMHIVGAGSFCARDERRPGFTPRLYNLLEIDRENFDRIRVHTRQQPAADGHWKGWHEWDDPDDPSNDTKKAYYYIPLNWP